MKESIEEMLNAIKSLRSEAFKAQNEELHNQLGRAFTNLLRAKELVR